MNIPDDVRDEARRRVDLYNQGKSRKYIARFNKSYLFLSRDDGGLQPGPVCRLRYTGDLDGWVFAIYKYSSGRYEPDECFFPGEEHVDGTLEGAMKAGDAAYWM